MEGGAGKRKSAKRQKKKSKPGGSKKHGRKTAFWLGASVFSFLASRIQKQADAGTRFSILVPAAVAEVAFLVALGQGALKSSASSADIGTQCCVSQRGGYSFVKDKATCGKKCGPSPSKGGNG
jgi:hypothetical protein